MEEERARNSHGRQEPDNPALRPGMVMMLIALIKR